MPKTSITKIVPKGAYGDYSVADSADIAFAAADVGNGNQFLCGPMDLVLVWNSGASAYTVTITSMADHFGRTKDITTYSIGAGEYAMFGPFTSEGWKQTDGYVYISANNVAVKFAVFQLQ